MWSERKLNMKKKTEICITVVWKLNISVRPCPNSIICKNFTKTSCRELPKITKIHYRKVGHLYKTLYKACMSDQRGSCVHKRLKTFQFSMDLNALGRHEAKTLNDRRKANNCYLSFSYTDIRTCLIKEPT